MTVFSSDAQPSAEAALNAFLRVPRERLDAKEQVLLARAEQATVLVEGQIVRTYTWGPLANAKTIILSHGLGKNAASMLNFVQPLVARQFRVVSFDHLAHGTSDGEAADLGAFARTLDVIARQFGPLTAIIGHSAGATTAVMALADNPSILCEYLVCLSPPLQCKTLFLRFARAVGLPISFVPMMHEAMLKNQIVSPERVVTEQLAERVKARTLVIHDEEDELVPLKDGARLAERIEGSRFEVTEGLGHYDVLQDVHVIERVVDFVMDLGGHC